MSKKKVAHCHWRIKDVAVGMAEALYETLMSSDEIRKQWKEKHPGASERDLIRAFVNKYWPQHIPAARATLATVLSGPYDDALKAQIHECLILDNTLRRGRSESQTVIRNVGE